MWFLFLLLVSVMASQVLASPAPLSPISPPPPRSLRRRDDSSSTTASTTINTTIVSPNGTDITSNFKTMFFNQPPSPVENLSNLTDRSLSRRQTNETDVATEDDKDWDTDYSRPEGYSRTITSCQMGGGPNWRFIRSECDYSRSMQAFNYWCRPFRRSKNQAPGHWGWYGPAKRLRGRCKDEETCVNGPTRNNQGDVEVAVCVRVEAFVELAFEAQEYQGVEGPDLEGKVLSAVASQIDGSTPLNVSTLDVKAGVAAADGSVGAVGVDGTVQKKTCEDCVGLETDQFAKGTEFLKTEATLVTGGAMMGVLWLAALSV